MGDERRTEQEDDEPDSRGISFGIPFPFIDDDFTLSIKLIEGWLFAALCLVIAAVVSVFVDIGSDADLSYYATVAQVIPVFLVALMVEIRSRLDTTFRSALSAVEENEARAHELQAVEQRARERGAHGPKFDAASEATQAFVDQAAAHRAELREYMPGARRVVRSYVLVAIPGEAACLAVLAANAGSTFALLLGALSLSAMALLWIRSLGSAFDLRG